MVPFDAASEVSMEEQRSQTMVRVQDALTARLGPEALGLLRAARSVTLQPPLALALALALSRSLLSRGAPPVCGSNRGPSLSSQAPLGPCGLWS